MEQRSVASKIKAEAPRNRLPGRNTKRTLAVARTLQAKIFLVVAGLVVTMGGSALLLQTHIFRQYELTMTQVLNASLAASIARELPKSAEVPGERDARPTFSRLMAVNPSIEIYLLSARGDIVAFTAPPGEVVRKTVDLGPVRSFIADDFVYPLLGDNPKDPGSRKIFSAAKRDPARDDAGYVYVILGGAEFDAVGGRIQGSLLLQSGIALALSGLLAGLLAMLYIRADVVSKLRRLIQAIKDFEVSGYRRTQSVVAGADGEGDEVDALTRAFGALTGHIEMLLAKLAETDRSRRELITNVSHDLRAPIASARAHLETLVIKKAALAEDQRVAHLDTALKQVQRLGRLAEELFELGKLEAPNARVTMERFPVAELVQDVIQKFQLDAELRGITLHGDLGNEMPRIQGDIALIERVLDNLLENAIRHTPPAGHVDVTVTTHGGNVVISVADTGDGISAEHLPHVFERFYRAHDRDGHDIGGAGLGLAIVRRIVELHGGAVSVESELGRGARFEVALPAAPLP